VEKGTVDLLRAAEALWRGGVTFHVVLAGPEMPNFRRYFATFGDAPRVRRLGVLTEEQKRDFFAGIDVFALPSRSDSFGLVLLEAWANGLPNLAYRAGGPAELVRDGRDGLLARCGDVDDLAAGIARLVGEPNLRHALGSEGRRRAENEFGWDNKLRLVREVMEDAVRDASEKRVSPSEASLIAD
jgi:glycosyltransferase involved in cell wall biosynthesis